MLSVTEPYVSEIKWAKLYEYKQKYINLRSKVRWLDKNRSQNLLAQRKLAQIEKYQSPDNISISAISINPDSKTNYALVPIELWFLLPCGIFLRISIAEANKIIE